jgi:GNAT superfamily N-acetyltransferase
MNPFRIRIQPCDQTHLPVLLEVARQSYVAHYTHLWHDNGEWYMERCFTRPVLENELEQPGSLFFLVSVNQEPAGFLKLNDGKPLKEQPAADCLEVERLYLLETAKGKGAGKAAMDFSLALARERNRKIVWLKTMDSSPAIGFYEACGFRRCGTETLPFEAMKPEYRGMYVMRREVG